MISPTHLLHRVRIALAACALTVLAGCVSTPSVNVPTGLDLPEKDQSGDGQTLDTGIEGRQTLNQTETPKVEGTWPSRSGVESDDALPPMNATPASINVQDVPVPAFANEVFGHLLGMNVSMTPQVSALQDLVTLRTQTRQPPQELFQLARQVLGEYGVTVTIEGTLVKLELATSGATTEPPLIISGRAAPQVPASHRPVFQLLELEVVSSTNAARWLQTLFGQELKISDESPLNSVLISGRASQVQQAVDALKVFDRPLMRGRISTRLEPAFMNAEELASRLIEVLNAQGYGANRMVGSSSSVIVLPIVSGNAVLVFASTREALDYAVSWARELDRPNQQAGTQSLFYYQVKNTKASELATILSGGSVGNAEASSNTATGAAGGGATPAPAPPRAAATSRSGGVQGQGQGALGNGTLQVDEPRNAIIYQGDPAQWERILTLIRQIDRAPRQVMIEVTIAEITLSDTQDTGINWFARHSTGRFNGNIWSGAGAGGEGGGSGGPGLTWLLDIGGQSRAVLTALATDNKANVLSTPRIMVKSGSEATMEVGDEIPTVSMTTSSNNTTGGTSNILQSIQYRKTGVLLTVKPTVYSGNRVDLDITQEVSQASDEAPSVSTAASAASPTIRNRSINTSLTLSDGQSIVMGGLVSNTQTDGNTGIPGLSKIPVLGHLFKSARKVTEKRELVVIIVPYIVEDDEQAATLGQAIIDGFEFIDLDRPLQP